MENAIFPKKGKETHLKQSTSHGASVKLAEPK